MNDTSVRTTEPGGMRPSDRSVSRRRAIRIAIASAALAIMAVGVAPPAEAQTVILPTTYKESANVDLTCYSPTGWAFGRFSVTGPPGQLVKMQLAVYSGSKWKAWTGVKTTRIAATFYSHATISRATFNSWLYAGTSQNLYVMGFVSRYKNGSWTAWERVLPVAGSIFQYHGNQYFGTNISGCQT